MLFYEKAFSVITLPILDMVYTSLSKIQWGLLEVQIVSYILSKNIEDRVKIIFGFSLCNVSLWVVLVTYFRRKLGKLRKLGPLEDGKMCHC